MPRSNLLHERSARALVLGVVLIALWAWRGPLTANSVSRQPLLRHEWKQCAEVVFVGDSSVRQGIYAATVEHALGDAYRVANFSYPAVSIVDANYLDAAEKVLDGDDRTLVISITSWNSSASSAHPYDVEAKDLASGPPPSVELDWHDQLDLRLAPRGLCALLWNACPWQTRLALGPGGQFVVDQWRDDETIDIPTATAFFATKPRADLDPLYRRIAELRQRGVRVVAYVERDRPLIAAISHLDRGPIESALRAAGAIVLDYPADLPTRDGTHLTHAAAQRWSAELGAALAKLLPHRDHAATTRCAWPE